MKVGRTHLAHRTRGKVPRWRRRGAVAEERVREAPSVLAVRAVLAIEHALIDPTAEGVAGYLNVYRSTAFRLLSRLVEAGILTRRMEQRDRIPQLGVYAVQLPTMPEGGR